MPWGFSLFRIRDKMRYVKRIAPGRPLHCRAYGGPMNRVVAMAVLLAGCTENSFSKIDDGNNGDGPAIEVDPSFLSFGTVGGDDDPVIQSFTVRSVGLTDLEISGMTIEGDNAGSFTIISPNTVIDLAPEEETTIDVAFEPLGANSQLAQVVISSNDPDNSSAIVDLVGDGAVPELEISPDPMDFGPSYIGCYKENQATLTNVGTSDLVIDSLSWSGDATIAFDNSGWSFPMTLAPGESTLANFSFLPDDEIDYAGTLVATSNEPLGTRYHEQMGSGKYAGYFTDFWEIPSDPPTDIFFAVDQSCSMDDDIATLSSNFSSFIGQLSSYSNDWQIIVGNGDDGCNDSGILTPGTSGYTSAFQSAVWASGGAYTESLLSVAANAAEAANGGCNNGFMRAGAMLHMILVSDEPEQSWDSWGNLVTRIQNAKGNPGMVKISAIAGPYPGGCGSADPGSGYHEAVAATGGVFLSICSNWASPSNLATLASASINQSNFELTRSAVGATIEVYVNGALRSAGTWSYNASTNTVTLADPVPGEGDEVQIDYAGEASCD